MAKLHKFPIGGTSDPVKQFNFYTSTAFEGCDIYDRNGRTFIVSEPYKEHTMPDISTSFIQIAGRIRNSIYADEVIHLYGTNGIERAVSPDEFETAIWNAVKETEKDLEHLNAISQRTRKSIIQNLQYNEVYLTGDVNDRLIVDRNMAKFEIVNYRTVNGIYSSQITVEDEMTKNGIDIMNNDSYEAPKNIKTMAAKRTNFKDTYKRYSEIMKEKPIIFGTDWEIELAEAIYPFIRKAYTKLGDKKIANLKYRVGAIQDALTAMSNASTDLKIVEMADRQFPKQTPIPVKEVKEKLQNIYDTLGLDKKAKATDMEQWYETSRMAKKIEGKTVSCMTIIRCQFIRSNI